MHNYTDIGFTATNTRSQYLCAEQEWHTDCEKYLRSSVLELVNYSYALSVVLFALNTCLLFLSTVGNGLVFFTIVFFQVLHIIPNIGMANLAGAGCAMGLLTHSGILAAITQSTHSCAFNSQVAYITLMFSKRFIRHGLLLSLCLVTIERYIGIVYCLRYTAILSEGKMIRAVIVVWVVSCTNSVIEMTIDINDHLTKILVSVTLGCILYCNIAILRISMKHKRQIAAQQTVIQNGPPPNFRGSKTVMLIFFLVCITEIPLIVTRVFMKSSVESVLKGTRSFLPWCLTLCYSRTTLYFVVYFWRSRQLRIYTKELCKKIVQKLCFG